MNEISLLFFVASIFYAGFWIARLILFIAAEAMNRAKTSNMQHESDYTQQAEAIKKLLYEIRQSENIQ